MKVSDAKKATDLKKITIWNGAPSFHQKRCYHNFRMNNNETCIMKKWILANILTPSVLKLDCHFACSVSFSIKITWLQYLEQGPKVRHADHIGPWEEFLRPPSRLITYKLYCLWWKKLSRYFPDFLKFCSATNPKLAVFQISLPYIQASCLRIRLTSQNSPLQIL